MASRGKKKTTMAKLSRESKLRERRLDKAARKEARRYEALNGPPTPEFPELDSETGSDEESTELESADAGAVAEADTDAGSDPDRLVENEAPLDAPLRSAGR